MAEGSELQSYTLTAQEQDRIRAEEVYRNLVKAQLDSRSRSRVVPCVAFLGQPFLLWLLSTAVLGIFIPLFSFCYQNQAARIRSREEKEKQRQKLALEISARCDQARSQLADTTRIAEEQASRGIKAMDGEISAPIYKELGERTLASLLYEEAYLVSEQQESLQRLAADALVFRNGSAKKKEEVAAYIKRVKEAVQPLLP